MITLLGIPWDRSSSFEPGAALAPAAIRAALHSASSNTWNERGDDVAAGPLLEDGGDVALPDDPADARRAIEDAVRGVQSKGRKPLILGGDHSITYPILRAFSGRASSLTVLHLDAHSDLYDAFPVGGGDRFSHACPFARVMEEKLTSRLLQVGIRTMTSHTRSQASKFGVEVVGADRWRDVIPLIGRIRGPVYVSLDLDVLEPMLAPGLSHPEPGGLTVREVLEVLAALRPPLIGADIVEYNPRNDVRDLTARVAAKFVKEMVGVMR